MQAGLRLGLLARNYHSVDNDKVAESADLSGRPTLLAYYVIYESKVCPVSN